MPEVFTSGASGNSEGVFYDCEVDREELLRFLIMHHYQVDVAPPKSERAPVHHLFTSTFLLHTAKTEC